MKRGIKAMVGVALLATVANCGAQREEEPILAVEVDTVANVVHVRNSGTAPRWRLRPVLTVGSPASVEEPADDEFGRVSSVAISPAGDLYVADQLNNEIKEFGLDGGLKLTIGRRGQGPGEFRSLNSIAWVGDILLAMDYRNGRIGEIAPDGSWLGQRPAPGGVSGPQRTVRFYAVGDNDVYAWSLLADSTGVRPVFVAHGVAGVGSTVPQAAWPDRPPSSIQCQRPDGGITYYDIPFAPRFLQHPAPGDLVATIWSASYRVVFLSQAGDTVKIVEREQAEVPLTDDDWNAALGDYHAFLDEWPGASCDPRSPRKPDAKPAVNDLLFDVRGRMWVEAISPNGGRWDVFDGEGALVFSLPSFPRSQATPPYLGRDRIAYVVEDSLGVQQVRISELGPVR